MTNDLVLCEMRGGTAIVTLNRADRRNALSRALIADLTAAFTRLRDDKAVRCVVLTGAGNVFCAGMDLAELQESLAAPGERRPVWADALKLAELYDLIYTLPQPTIAAVNGTAVAGGAGLVSVCDLAVAVPEAKFGYPEVRRGLVAAMVLPHLLRHVGEHSPLSTADRGNHRCRRSVPDRVHQCRRANERDARPCPRLESRDCRGRAEGAGDDERLALSFLAPGTIGE